MSTARCLVTAPPGETVFGPAVGLGTEVYPLAGEVGDDDVVVAGGAVVVVDDGKVVVVVVARGGGGVTDLGARSCGEASVTEVSVAANSSGTAPSPLSSPPPPGATTRAAATASAAIPARVHASVLDLTDIIMPRPRSDHELELDAARRLPAPRSQLCPLEFVHVSFQDRMDWR